MTIKYNTSQHVNVVDGFSQILRETAEYFEDKGVSINGTSFTSDILSEQSLFNDYKEKLSAGLPVDQIDNFENLMENARMAILSEASVSGVQQLAGLSMPTIRKMWAKIALKHAIPTQVVKQPRFAISYTRAYLIDSEGNKHEIPESINALDNTRAELPRLKEDPIDLPADEVDLFALSTVPASKFQHDKIDRKFFIKEVVMEVEGEEKTIKHLRIPADIHSNINSEVVYVDEATGEETKDMLLGQVDFGEGILHLTSLRGTIKSVVLDARLTQETNKTGESVTFDVETREVEIGTGAHLNAPLPIEWLTDTMAIYNIDGAAEVIDLMSQTSAQKLEIEIYNFLKTSLEVNQSQYRSSFNLEPSAGYSGSPKEWREELKTVVDHLAIRMKRDAKFDSGKFVIIGSPVDMQLLPNVNWSFSGDVDDEGGVSVSHSLGAFSGSNRYELVSSDLLPDGELLMFFVPSSDRLMTYKYYPYTFNVEKGYRDPNFENVPSIMMTKRHTIEEFTPLIASIEIKNNTGQVPETPGY